MSDSVNEGCHVLIIEDDPKDAETIDKTFSRRSADVAEELAKRALRIPTIETHLCKSRDEAVDWLGQVHSKAGQTSAQQNPCPDLVILDLQIPREKGGSARGYDPSDLAGFDVLKYIRVDLKKRIGYDIPVVMLSHNLSASHGERSHGFSQFKDVLARREYAPPNDILQKTDVPPKEGQIRYLSPEALLRKTAQYLIDLDEEDCRLLERHSIFYGSPGSGSWRALRQLKRYARSAMKTNPLPDILLLGENGVGKSTFARAYHLFRQAPEMLDGRRIRLGFHNEDLGSLDPAGSAPSLRLFGGTQFSAGDANSEWTMGAFIKTTFYNQPNGNAGRPFPGQECEEWTEDGPIPVPSLAAVNPPGRGRNQPGNADYPDHSNTPNFEHSGTLFLDEVINVDPAIRKMLLQALSYNRRDRFVFTTGVVSRTIRVGPAIVMATRKKIEDLSEEDDIWGAAKDYMFRIDQVRITIPPLAERLEEIVPYLQHQLLIRRRGGRTGEPEPEIKIDPNVLELLKSGTLTFDNNLADLDRILDQVSPEEESITFRHVKPLFERDHPIIIESDEDWPYDKCKDYLTKLFKNPRPISLLKKDRDKSKQTVYGIVLAFLDLHDFPKKGWTEIDYFPYFDMTKGAFTQELGRLRPLVRPGEVTEEGLKTAVGEDLRKFRDKP